MKKTLFVFLSVMLALCALSCSNGSDDSAQLAYLNYLALLKSKSYSARLSAALNYAAPAVTEEAPNVLLIEGDSIQNMTEAQFRQAVNVIIHGKTLVILNCSPSQILAFGVKLKALSDQAAQAGDTQLVASIEQDGDDTWSPKDFLAQVTNDVLDVYKKSDPPTIFDTKIYEALGVRKNHVYYVHPTDQNLAKLLLTENSSVEQVTEIQTEGQMASSTASPAEDKTEEVIQASVKAFADWILQKESASSNVSKSELSSLLVQANQAATPDTLKMLKDAQETFTHNFMVEVKMFNGQDGGSTTTAYFTHFTGNRENVSVETKVWAVCDIDNGQDYYLVKTSAACHNEQLFFLDQWKYMNRLGPYFDTCKISTTMDPSKQHIDATECQPQTQSGSTTYTKGFTFSLTSNVGFVPKSSISGGPGVQFTDSNTRSIPDISVNTVVDDSAAKWTFAGRSFDPSPSAFVADHPEVVTDIQKKLAVFDTYTIIKMPSDPDSGAQTQLLTTDVYVSIAAVCRIWRSWNLGYNKWIIWKGKYEANPTYKDKVKKPCNAMGEYIMAFKSPAGATNEMIDRLQAKLKEYVSTWGSNVKYYAVGKNNVDAAAKSNFAVVKQKITNNKNVFTDNNIKGTYKFYIKNTSAPADTYVDSFELAF